MHAAGIRSLGGPVEQLELPDPPEPGDHQVLIEVHAAGIGNWDDLVRTGAWDVGIRPPMALGVEAAGIIRAVGRGVTRFTSGDAVMVHSAPLPYQGAWAELFLAGEADTAARPASIGSRVGAALPVPLLTAAQVIARLACQPDTALLVHGAGGVTGGLLVLMAAEAGCRVLATASRESAARVSGYGAVEVVDYREATWQARLRAAAPQGFSVVVNVVRGAAASVLPLVADGGRLVTITGDPPPSERRIGVTNAYVAPDGPALEEAAILVARRRVSIPIAGTLSLRDAGGALRQAAMGARGGSRVIDPRR